MHIGITGLIVIHDGVNHTVGLLRGSGIIQIHQGMLIGQLRKYWELLAQFNGIKLHHNELEAVLNKTYEKTKL